MHFALAGYNNTLCRSSLKSTRQAAPATPRSSPTISATYCPAFVDPRTHPGATSKAPGICRIGYPATISATLAPAACSQPATTSWKRARRLVPQRRARASRRVLSLQLRMRVPLQHRQDRGLLGTARPKLRKPQPLMMRPTEQIRSELGVKRGFYVDGFDISQSASQQLWSLIKKKKFILDSRFSCLNFLRVTPF